MNHFYDLNLTIFEYVHGAQGEQEEGVVQVEQHEPIKYVSFL